MRAYRQWQRLYVENTDGEASGIVACVCIAHTFTRMLRFRIGPIRTFSTRDAKFEFIKLQLFN